MGCCTRSIFTNSVDFSCKGKQENTDNGGDETIVEINITDTFTVCSGADGADGADGSPGLSNYDRKSMSLDETLPHLANSFPSLFCSGGKKVIGGGCSTLNALITIISNRATSDTTWSCGFTNQSGNAQNTTLDITVICADVQ